MLNAPWLLAVPRGASGISPTVGPATPALVQMVSSSTNIPNVQGLAGSNFKFTLPNSSKAGNCLILAMSHDNAVTVTITDNLGNSWGPAATSADGGTGNTVAAIYVLPNTGAGYGTWHAACSPTSGIFQYVILEECNIATSSPVNGTASAAGISPAASTSLISTGSITPTVNNDGNGGNLVISYFALNRKNWNTAPTSFTKGTPNTLLATDVMVSSPGNQNFGFLIQYSIETGLGNTGSVNPTCTAPTTSADTVDTYNCVAVALKVANAGSPKPAAGSGIIWINSIQHFSTTGAPATWTVQAPSIGDMRCVAVPDGSDWTVADSDGSTYAAHGGAADGITSKTFETAGKSANTAMTLSITTNTGAGGDKSFRYFDISNAASSPFVAYTFVNSNVQNVTVRNDFPDYTPSFVGSLVIANGENGLGPTTGFNTGSPTNAVFDLRTFPEQNDGDAGENSDTLAHVTTTSLTTLTWNWTVANTAAGANCMSIEYKHG